MQKQRLWPFSFMGRSPNMCVCECECVLQLLDRMNMEMI